MFVTKTTTTACAGWRVEGRETRLALVGITSVLGFVCVLDLWRVVVAGNGHSALMLARAVAATQTDMLSLA